MDAVDTPPLFELTRDDVIRLVDDYLLSIEPAIAKFLSHIERSKKESKPHLAAKIQKRAKRAIARLETWRWLGGIFRSHVGVGPFPMTLAQLKTLAADFEKASPKTLEELEAEEKEGPSGIMDLFGGTGWPAPQPEQ